MALQPSDIRGDVLNAIDLSHIKEWERIIDLDLSRMRDYEPEHCCTANGVFSVFLPSNPSLVGKGYPPFNVRFMPELVSRYKRAGWPHVEYKYRTYTEVLNVQGEALTTHWLILSAAPPRLRQSESRPTPKNPRRGFVYLFQCNGLYKIGRSKNPSKRMRKMASAIMPFEITRLHSIPCKDAVAAERSLHTQFADKRRKGEWFDLSEIDVMYIKAISAL